MIKTIVEEDYRDGLRSRLTKSVYTSYGLERGIGVYCRSLMALSERPMLNGAWLMGCGCGFSFSCVARKTFCRRR